MKREKLNERTTYATQRSSKLSVRIYPHAGGDLDSRRNLSRKKCAAFLCWIQERFQAGVFK